MSRQADTCHGHGLTVRTADGSLGKEVEGSRGLGHRGLHKRRVSRSGSLSTSHNIRVEAHRIGTVSEVQSSGVQFCEADLQDAVDVVLKLPENLPAMPTMLGQTDVPVQDTKMLMLSLCDCNYFSLLFWFLLH